MSRQDGFKETLSNRANKILNNYTTNIKNVLLAGLSGLMLTASFAPIALDWIAWISLIPLLISLENKSLSDAFKIGLLAGLFHYLTLIYWIVNVLSRYGNLNPIVSLAVLLLLSFYLSLYLAFFALAVAIFKKIGYLHCGERVPGLHLNMQDLTL